MRPHSAAAPRTHGAGWRLLAAGRIRRRLRAPAADPGSEPGRARRLCAGHVSGHGSGAPICAPELPEAHSKSFRRLDSAAERGAENRVWTVCGAAGEPRARRGGRPGGSASSGHRVRVSAHCCDAGRHLSLFIRLWQVARRCGDAGPLFAVAQDASGWHVQQGDRRQAAAVPVRRGRLRKLGV
ncbi:hypothetical protein KL930_004247 [Ogataea haglerorum]|nr:hypothetical protein KL930_004247 [Ogataea haglerorum]KAG7776484.1 hypothetical protein KL922_003560 [Ogataea haglerorum]